MGCNIVSKIPIKKKGLQQPATSNSGTVTENQQQAPPLDNRLSHAEIAVSFFICCRSWSQSLLLKNVLQDTTECPPPPPTLTPAPTTTTTVIPPTSSRPTTTSCPACPSTSSPPTPCTQPPPCTSLAPPPPCTQPPPCTSPAPPPPCTARVTAPCPITTTCPPIPATTTCPKTVQNWPKPVYVVNQPNCTKTPPAVCARDNEINCKLNLNVFF